MSRQFSFKRGDDWVESFTLKSSRIPVDITGYTFNMNVRKGTQDAIISASSGTGEFTLDADPATGVFNLLVPKEDTVDLTPGEYDMDIEVTDSLGTKISTKTYTVNIVRDITYGD